MAVDAKGGWAARTGSRQRELAMRVLLGGLFVLVAVSVVVFFQTRADGGQGPTAARAGEPQVVPEQTAKPGGALDPDARAVAVQFIRTTLARKNLAQAWRLATPDLRAGTTKKEWLGGTLPIAPFPVTKLETSGFNVVGTAPNKILLQVLLVPTPDSDYIPTRYDVTLVRRAAGAPWKVSYFLPYAPPGIYAEPN